MNINILIAEHDAHDLEMIHHELSKAGMKYAFKEVQNEVDFTAAITLFKPDLILSDFTFPAFNGLRAFEIRCKLAPLIPFIIISGTIGEENSIELIKQGITDFVLKDKLFTLTIKIARAIKSAEEAKQRVIAEQRLRDSELKFRSVVEQASDAICILDNDFHLTDINESGCSMLGYTKDEFLGLSLEELIPDKELLLNPFKITELQHGHGLLNERILKRKDKSLLQIELSSKMLEDGRVLLLARDITARKESEQIIKNSEQRFRTLFEQNLAGFYQSDLSGKIIICNEAFARMLKYDSAAELMQVNAHDLYFSPDERDNFITKVVENKNLTNQENVLKCKDGTPLFVLENISEQSDVSGNKFFDGIIIDITEKKDLENLLAKVGRLAKIGGWEYNVMKQSLYWSGDTKNIHETEDDFVPDMASAAAFFKKGRSRDTIAVKIKQGIKSGTPWDEELQIITAKGNGKWVRVIGHAEFKDDKCIKIFGSFQDIDERKKAELANIKVLKEKNKILESIKDGFFAVDKNWIVTYWNNQAEQLLKVQKSLIVGKNLWDVFADSSDSISYKEYHQALKSMRPTHFEDYFPFLNQWFDISAFPSETGLAVYFKNITERKVSEIRMRELNEELLDRSKVLAVSNAELEQFAYVASHDLQEPLRMVTSFLTQLNKKYGHLIDAKGQKYIHYATDGASRMRNIILDLLEYSKAGKKEAAAEDIDLNELIHDIEVLFSKEIEDKKCTMASVKLPVIKNYRSPVLQVFQNIIGNALKYARADTPLTIHVSVTDINDYWQFSIKDNGIGIEDEYFEKIFVIFQRLHNKEDYGGTGMGLSITKKIIESSGGKIWLESVPGTGTTFHFTFPNIK